MYPKSKKNKITINTELLAYTITKLGDYLTNNDGDILIAYTRTRRKYIALFSAETTGPIFTKILHDIVALVALLNHAYTRRYPIPFLNASATKVWSLPFFYKIGCDVR